MAKKQITKRGNHKNAPLKQQTMRNTAQFFRIKWKGYELEIEAYVSGGDVEIESIEGISTMDMYFEAMSAKVGEIETLIAERHAETINEPQDY